MRVRFDNGLIPSASNGKRFLVSLAIWSERHNCESHMFIDMSSPADGEGRPFFNVEPFERKAIPSSFELMVADKLLHGFPASIPRWRHYQLDEFAEFAQRCWAEIEAFAIAPEPSEPVAKAAAKRL